MDWMMLGLAGMNIFGVFLMWYDKRQAKRNGWRVPESRLFLTALFGGAIGVFIGMRLFRHKTKHWSFQIGVPLLLLLNIVTVTILSNMK